MAGWLLLGKTYLVLCQNDLAQSMTLTLLLSIKLYHSKWSISHIQQPVEAFMYRRPSKVSTSTLIFLSPFHQGLYVTYNQDDFENWKCVLDLSLYRNWLLVLFRWLHALITGIVPASHAGSFSLVTTSHSLEWSLH